MTDKPFWNRWGFKKKKMAVKYSRLEFIYRTATDPPTQERLADRINAIFKLYRSLRDEICHVDINVQPRKGILQDV